MFYSKFGVKLNTTICSYPKVVILITKSRMCRKLNFKFITYLSYEALPPPFCKTDLCSWAFLVNCFNIKFKNI
jgi:hypothetical protein